MFFPPPVITRVPTELIVTLPLPARTPPDQIRMPSTMMLSLDRRVNAVRSIMPVGCTIPPPRPTISEFVDMNSN